jgi:hypothetical protein
MAARLEVWAEQAAKCPACGRLQEWFTLREDGTLGVKGQPRAIVTGYVCEGCGRTIHWHVRRKGRTPR